MASPTRALAATPASQGSHGRITDWVAAGAAAGWAGGTVTGGAVRPPLSIGCPFGVGGVGAGGFGVGGLGWAGSRR
jgi:hypothetical protein